MHDGRPGRVRFAVSPASGLSPPRSDPPPVTFARALGAVAAAAVLPGLGHFLLGRRRTGTSLGVVVLLAVGALGVTVLRLQRAGLLQILVSTRALRGITVVCASTAVLWTAVIVWTYVLTRPRRRSVVRRVLGGAVVAALCAGVVGPLGTAAHLADTQRRLLDAVFSTSPAGALDATADSHASTPMSGALLPPRWNVLLLGSDAGPDRTGARTDTIMVASIDTRTAATILIGLPRNIEHAPFPPGSPMAIRFPDGFHDRRSPRSGDYLLNNVAEYGEEHPELAPAGPTADRGLNLLMSSVSYLLALSVDHYVEVDMAGLAAIIDALGGVTVDVGPVPLPIGGVTYSGRHVTPDGYVPAGTQHLDGNQALWFARSRRNADDYARMARQRCLVDAVLTQKSPRDVVTHFRSVAAATESSVTTNIPQAVLPALLTLADEHRPPRIRSISFDPDLLDPNTASGRFDPARPDVAYMREVVGAAITPAPTAQPATAQPGPPTGPTPPTATAPPPTAAPLAPICATRA
jgi:polyisoprenyl-teichoic acid--peptidoglycan teichoic acid transferase